MKIELDKKEFKNLILLVAIGEYIRGGLADERGEDFTYWEKIKEKILNIAKDNDMDEMIEDYKGRIIMSERLSNEVDRIIEDHNESEFWHLLEVRLGQRDFYREATEKELETIEDNHGILPYGKINNYYKKYEEEFEENGLERLEINEN